ncbi:LANO_0F08262g1_1 [Lachancea nothofagi CBS 11611]|uniref:LANO_0F08262g1_1 n=1 Tax=Lachancea nothofagi CBS 11611 TaxID=1266666 RepID=A0A1G4K9D7_9SACH|nr:LANO_0F08262g1_1 [Lachancea nothofagi CBS 11611]
MANVLNIPGFYYDTERKRYFKITQHASSKSDQKYERESIKKQDDHTAYKDSKNVLDRLKEKALHETEFDIINPFSREFGPDVNYFKKLTTRYNIAKSGEQTDDFDLIQKSGVWSDLTPLLGSVAQKAKALVCLPKQNSLLVITDRMNIILLNLAGSANYIYQEQILAKSECEFAKTHLNDDHLCVIMSAKGLGATSIAIIKLNASDLPEHISTAIYSSKKHEVSDAAFNNIQHLLAAQSNKLMTCKPAKKQSRPDTWRTVHKDKSDVMCMELGSQKAVHKSPWGWFGTRSGALYQMQSHLTPSNDLSELLCRFPGSSILNIRELGEEHLLVSGINAKGQILAVVPKSSQAIVKTCSPILLLLKTSVRNLVQETEVIKTSADGRFVLYGRKNTGSSDDTFELFSTWAADNLIRDIDAQAGVTTYYPIKVFSDCFPPDSLKHFETLVEAELHVVKKGDHHFGTTCKKDGLRLLILTKDTDAAGINLRSSHVI